MGGSRLLGMLVVVASVAAVVVACSSVPEIEFVDADATVAASDSGGTSSGTVKSDASAGPADAAADQSAPGTYCTNGGKANPPPGGICCGSLACIGCSGSDCSDCDGRCKVTGPACCKKGQVRCAAVDLCK